MKSAGHVAITREVVYQYTILVEKRKREQTTRENCAFLGEANIKINLKETGCTDLC